MYTKCTILSCKIIIYPLCTISSPSGFLYYIPFGGVVSSAKSIGLIVLVVYKNGKN
jgi:hypothetical protein